MQITALPSSTSGDDQFLLPTLQQILPTLVSYLVIDTIVQSNAVGYILGLSYEKKNFAQEHHQEDKMPAKLFVKHVDATHYAQTKKTWNDLRRTLMYARTEKRFYRDFAPLLRGVGFNAIPHHFAVFYHLSDWMPETERASAPSNPNMTIDQLPEPKIQHGGILVLEWIDSETYFQDSPISIAQAKQCLSAVAELHLAAWEKVDLLKSAQEQLSQASFHLNTRNPSELAGIEVAWDHFLTEFREPMLQARLWKHDSVQNLGRRMAATAQYVSDQVSPQPTDRYATIAHGDYKSMNVFIAKSGDAPAKMVDYASTGIGLGISDVAMHIHHAVRPEDLDNGGEEELVKHYWTTVTDSLGSKEAYPWNDALRQYRFAVVDYARFFLARFWKSATIENMEKKADSKNTCLLNRNVPAAMAFVRRVDEYLTEVEAEMAQCKAA